MVFFILRIKRILKIDGENRFYFDFIGDITLEVPELSFTKIDQMKFPTKLCFLIDINEFPNFPTRT